MVGKINKVRVNEIQMKKKIKVHTYIHFIGSSLTGPFRRN